MKGSLDHEEEFVFGLLKNIKPLSGFRATERNHLGKFTFKRIKKPIKYKMDLQIVGCDPTWGFMTQCGGREM